jgi:hypothetical protein
LNTNDNPGSKTKETAQSTDKFSSAFENFVTSKHTLSAEPSGPVFHESISVTRVSNEDHDESDKPGENLEVCPISITPITTMTVEEDQPINGGSSIAAPVFQSSISVSRVSSEAKDDIICLPGVAETSPLPGSINLPSSVSVQRVSEEASPPLATDKKQTEVENLNLPSSLSVKRVSEEEPVNPNLGKTGDSWHTTLLFILRIVSPVLPWSKYGLWILIHFKQNFLVRVLGVNLQLTLLSNLNIPVNKLFESNCNLYI